MILGLFCFVILAVMGKGNFLTGEWKKLVMFNYPVDPNLLKPYVPPHTELDLWNNTCYVSLVGFKFVDTKVKGIKIPFHVNFEEINLRFYVRYKDLELGWKRGVVFIKEIVPKFLIAWVANTVYREHYIALPMRYNWDLSDKELNVSYGVKKDNEWFSFGVVAENTPQPLVDDSETEFITEHFWGYAKWDNTTCNEYEVGHPRWDTYPIKSQNINFNFGKIYGQEFSFLNEIEPISIYLAEGSEIFVNKGLRISG